MDKIIELFKTLPTQPIWYRIILIVSFISAGIVIIFKFLIEKDLISLGQSSKLKRLYEISQKKKDLGIWTDLDEKQLKADEYRIKYKIYTNPNQIDVYDSFLKKIGKKFRLESLGNANEFIEIDDNSNIYINFDKTQCFISKLTYVVSGLFFFLSILSIILSSFFSDIYSQIKFLINFVICFCFSVYFAALNNGYVIAKKLKKRIEEIPKNDNSTSSTSQ